jgi:hypothetical protein
LRYVGVITCKCRNKMVVAGEAIACKQYEGKHYFPVSLPKNLCRCEAKPSKGKTKLARRELKTKRL